MLVNKFKEFKYHVCLITAAVIWGLGTVFMKEVVDDIDPFWLASTRFFSAGVILTSMFLPKLIKLYHEKRLLDHIRVGMLVGIPMMIGYMLNAFGLTGTTASKSSFLTGLYCVMVPFIAWVLTKKRPTSYNLAAAFLCVCGIAMVSIAGNDTFSISWGDSVTLASAFFMAIQLALTSKLAPGRDMLAITALSFLLAGGSFIGVAAAISAPPQISALLQPDMISSIVYLVIFATCAALLLQNIGLAKVSASQGSLLLSFESVFGAIFGIALLGESLTFTIVIGFLLIFASVVVSEWLPTTGVGASARRKLMSMFPSAINIAPTRRKANVLSSSARYNSKLSKMPQEES